MKPVWIFRHVACEGPGYLGEVLKARGIPWSVVEIDAGMAVPELPDQASGLVFMGGPMSANDSLPHVLDELALIRKACHQGVPLLGHCLGGQLISKALGGKVTPNPVTEIGWFPVTRVALTPATAWLAAVTFPVVCFHWHGETFSLPDGASPLFSSQYCVHQGFVRGNAIGLQCHVEMQADMVPAWLEYYREEMPAPSPSVQSREEMLRDLEQRIASLHVLADIIYDVWITGLQK